MSEVLLERIGEVARMCTACQIEGHREESWPLFSRLYGLRKGLKALHDF